MKKITHTKPYLSGHHKSELLKQFQSGMVNEGECCKKLIEKLATKFGHAGGVLQSTGTHALALAIQTLSMRLGCVSPRVLISNYSCHCLIDAVHIANGVPILCDINSDNLSLCVDAIQKIIAKNPIDIIIVPHMFGLPADIGKIEALGIPVIEDCAHSPGARFKEQMVGSFSKLAVYSFEGSKILPAGEGGAVLANQHSMTEILIKTKCRKGSFHKHSRLSDIIASVVIAQIKEYEVIIKRRQKIAKKYSQYLSDLSAKGVIRLPKTYDDREHIYYRYIIQVSPKELQRLIKSANIAGILLKQPIATGPLSMTSFVKGRSFPNSFAVHSSSVSIPIYPDLKDKD